MFFLMIDQLSPFLEKRSPHFLDHFHFIPVIIQPKQCELFNYLSSLRFPFPFPSPFLTSILDSQVQVENSFSSFTLVISLNPFSSLRLKMMICDGSFLDPRDSNKDFLSFLDAPH